MLPATSAETWSNTKHALDELEAHIVRPPSFAQLVHHLIMSPNNLLIIRKAIRAVNTPTQSGSADGELTINDLVPDTNTPTPDEAVMDSDNIRHLLDLLSDIDEREAIILRLRYGLAGEDPMTLKQIGQRIGLTRERVRQIEHEALRKLRDAMLSKV